MDLNEQLKITGSLTIVKTNSDGIITDKRHIPNLVVTAGKTFIVSRMIGVTSPVMTHMGVGTGVVAPALPDVALGIPLGARVALTSATQATNTVTFVATYNAGVSTGALTEAGIFNDVTTGTMLCRTSFPVVNKAVSDSIAITWVVTIS
jgi:L-cysteine desulfidase